MSIEQKIAQILAESKAAEEATKTIQEEEIVEEVVEEEAVKPEAAADNPDNKRNNVQDEKEAEGGTSKKPNAATKDAAPGDQSKERLPEEIEYIYEDADDNDDDKEYPVKHKGKEIGAVYQMNGKWVAHHNASGVTTGLADKKTALSRLNVMHAKHHGVKGVKEQYDASEDVAALVNGEDLSEEFKTKAATIFEAAVTTRVKTELARIEESFEQKLQEATEQIKEGLVEQVDGYLDYVVEQWIAQNEIALEHGMKSEILEGFVAGLKGLFEEHYIDIPEEKFDVLGSLEEQVEQLEAKLNEQVAANVELNKTVGEMKRAEIVAEASEGLTDTEVEKLQGLAEELSYEDAESFKTKVQTIRENYFTTKAQADVKSVVTDTPVETLTEDKKLDPQMSAYLSILNRK